MGGEVDGNGWKWLQMDTDGLKGIKNPWVPVFVGNPGVLAVLAVKETGDPSPTSKKRHPFGCPFLLVREAGLEGFS